ncbi:MAG: NAD(P)/FAD-dependent oxidoreductase [Clostridiales bacterium]|nr:NAD(P)/FAD-dependent oxidoreductase [Clostridiales bacterium]
MENIIIVGAGPAGISAALYCARGNLRPLVIHNGIGALEKAEKIENYYGLEEPLSGRELYERGLAQARSLGVRLLEAQVLGIGGFDTFEVQTTAGVFETLSVILATGGKRTAPKIPGVREFEGRGVSYCAVCDAFFYRGKPVAVLGNGDFALHEAEELCHTASGVTIFTDGLEPEFSRHSSIPVNTMKIQAIEGQDRVLGIRLQSGNVSGELSVQEAFPSWMPAEGVFVALGTAGSAEIARQMGAELTEKGNIKVGPEMETTIPGLYAAGDCTGGLLQVSKAVYEGAKAGLCAGRYVRGKRKVQDRSFSS